MKNKIIVIIAIVFLIVIAIIFNRSQDNNNLTVNSDNDNNVSLINNDTQKNNSSYEKDSIENMLSDFLSVYYNIHSEDNSKNYALQHFEEYKIYMTEKCQEKYKPNKVPEEQDQNIGYSYNLDLIRYKIYYDMNFSQNNNQSKVLCFIETRTQLGDIKPNLSTSLLNLELKKEDNKWLVDDIILKQLMDFPTKPDTLFD